MNLFCAALTVFLAAAPASAQDAGNWDARVTAVTGDVTVYPPEGGEAVSATVDLPLEEGDRVEVAAGSSAELSLDGGSLITLGENTKFTLEKTAKSGSVFFLSLGSLRAKIQSLGADRLSVRTPTTVAAVRGTEFGVEADDAEESRVGVFDEGRVEVTGSGATEVLTPNQETTVTRGNAPLRPFGLKRFLARRGAMRAQLKRLQVVRKGWKSLSGPKRRAMRHEFLKRLRQQRREQRQQRLDQRREGGRMGPGRKVQEGRPGQQGRRGRNKPGRPGAP